MNLFAIYVIVYGSCVLGILWALINFIRISRIDVHVSLLGNENSSLDNDRMKPESLSEIGGHIAQVYL